MAPESSGTGSTSRPRIKDVARLAGVGVGTVSRVVNGGANVSAASAEAVERAIEALGYRRNESARGLRIGATESIALLVEDVADPFFSLLNRAVEDEVIERGSVLLTASSSKDARRARELILTFCARRVDGLVVTLPESGDEEYLLAEQRAGTPMVFVDRPPRTFDADTVIADNRGGAREGVAHLLAQGHLRIACITDRADLFTASERLAGYRRALDDAGVAFDPSLVFSAAPDAAAIDAELARMLASASPPTAVFAGNNRTCVHVISALHLRGAQLAVVGFDDFELADLVVPGITVIAQDPQLMGRTAMDLLLARIDGADEPPRRVVLGTRLVARGSGELPVSGGGSEPPRA
ncbi:LacI family DNA-binding transcriptional regulator [Streptomyces sp. AC495_CC817]|uniref:LacI family DNA-binding transcriptional regulator n=1 Tax=Streptomyces sp. AC495_CC817 TaxID=2823900 RepID=UPI0027DFEE91|nr:LacI family DNA-binding transcriptional regulator [Streptomyces sp. AC495_CC817]